MGNDKKQLKVKQSGIMNIRGKDVATYPALIDYAHQGGIQSLEVAMLQFPSESNFMKAICGARLVKTSGEVFSDIGDASPDNVPRGCTDSYIRIASTRAKSRVLSDAYNIRNAMEVDQEEDSVPILLTASQDAINVYGLPEGQSQDKNSLQGGGSKPISAGQASAIHKCAAKHGLDPEKVARDMYGKSIAELVGWEADQCIKSFRNR